MSQIDFNGAATFLAALGGLALAFAQAWVIVTTRRIATQQSELHGEVKELHASVNGQSEDLKRISKERDIGIGQKQGQDAERLIQAEAKASAVPVLSPAAPQVISAQAQGLKIADPAIIGGKR